MKVGDRVKVIQLITTDKELTNLQIGMTGTIIEQCADVCSVKFDKKIKHASYNWNDKTQTYDMLFFQLEKIEDNKNDVIVIYRKDNEVIALDKRTGKKAAAKCHPDEKFNFDAGAKLAFERLTNGATFKILALKDHTTHPKMIKGKIYEFINGVTTWDDGCKSKKYAGYNDFIENNCCYDTIVVELQDGDDPKEILKEYENNIKIGDTVKVINVWDTFSRYDTWQGLGNYSGHFVEHKQPLKDKKYKVLNVDNHNDDTHITLALIQDADTTQVFIVDVRGLEKC